METEQRERSKMQKDDFLRYLQIYNADIDWLEHVRLLQSRLNGDMNQVMKRIAATILMPAFDRSSLTDPPEKLLFVGNKFALYDKHDWLAELDKVWKEDQRIAEVRKQALGFGVVYPLEYNPRTRQAFSWLMERARHTEAVNDENEAKVKEKMENIVLVYGGALVCNVFEKKEYGRTLDKLPNWRSGYFFERLIHRIYKPAEILKIKQHDINDIKGSNPKLIKKVSN